VAAVDLAAVEVEGVRCSAGVGEVVVGVGVLAGVLVVCRMVLVALVV
jgi:hypothetical protein